MYKLIALDIDGTLLDPLGKIRPRVRQAIQRAVEIGCIVTLATGRRYRSACQVAADLGVATPFILYSGSLIYDPQTDRPLLHRPLSPDFVRLAIELLQEAGLNPGLFQSPLHGEHIVLGPPENDDPYLGDYAAHPSRADLVKRQGYLDMAQLPDPLVVFSAAAGRVAQELVAGLRRRFPTRFNLYSYPLQNSALPDLYGIDFLPADHTKAVALEWLAHHHNLELSQTIAIGDGLNDLDMLRAAGLGVAMGNAYAEVKESANVVVASNAEDGVAEAIERFVLS